MAAAPTGRPHSAAAGRRLTSGLAWYAQYLFYLFKCFQTNSNYDLYKLGVLLKFISGQNKIPRQISNLSLFPKLNWENLE
jgi:hypothetical protein